MEITSVPHWDLSTGIYLFRLISSIRENKFTWKA